MERNETYRENNKVLCTGSGLVAKKYIETNVKTSCIDCEG